MLQQNEQRSNKREINFENNLEEVLGTWETWKMFLHIDHTFFVINDFASCVYCLFPLPSEIFFSFFFLHILISFRTIM